MTNPALDAFNSIIAIQIPQTDELGQHAVSLVRTALSNAPEVVTVDELMSEKQVVDIFDGYTGFYGDAVRNVNNALKAIARHYKNGLKITAAPNGGA